MTPPIRILPPELQSQIAAGEVLERPASAVKELVENSLDAGATSIDVEIDRGGQERILVQDNGQGIAEQDLPLALTRHATSKIVSLDDLQRISSFGFRGEALASIASVSRTLITTIVPGADQGIQAEAVHGKLAEIRPAAIARGTRIEVRDLFANVPVRLKFLKTTATEAKRCQEAMAHMALAHLDVSFSLTHNGREIFRFLAGESLEHRLQRIWPPHLVQDLVPIQRERDGMRITGLVGTPGQAQGRGDRIIMYVNDRPVKDKLLLRALRQGYKGTLLSKEYPQAVLFLRLPTREVDVNVHPAKTEVRFLDERAIFSLIQGAVRNGLDACLAQADLQPLAPQPTWAERNVGMNMPEQVRQGEHQTRPSGSMESPWDNTSRQPKFASLREAERLYTFAQGMRPAKDDTALTAHPGEEPPERLESDGPASPVGPHPGTELVRQADATHDITYHGQFHRTYLIISRGDTLLLMDQHAAHERVLYHAFSTAGRHGEHQRLAIPMEMSLHPSEREVLEKIWNDLDQIGFTLERPEPATVVIRAIPTSLETGEAMSYLRTVLAEQTRDMDSLWTTLACKSAIKAGQVLTHDEAMSLIQAWSQCPDNRYCPHGRPVILTWTVREVEKRFKRKP
ncbi:DNA mismatch repair endonuclease MutL [Desulfoplanes formicivorans]|uniref:DNA mismatch repair protein MutL n=1 Tax=Desulfoplanes formicivorans TaxID=1592317 RepID=A0A194AG29_9BACT|nr:DNA mismatch repair endonuclease MutL [Desulfoplanes formicivorans]GAU08041.1 DNA mismatch repair protein MutL [Desulfoplanes formicivorans]